MEELRNVAKERNLKGKDVPEIDDKDLSLEAADQAKRTATGARSALAYFFSKF